MRVGRLAALYNIHGNLPALDAVLAELEDERVELVVVGGDVAAGPLPRATLERLAELDERALHVRGNADREVVEAYEHNLGPDGVADAAARARRPSPPRRSPRPSALSWLTCHRMWWSRSRGSGPLRCWHGSPRSDTEMLTTATTDERLLSVLAGLEEPTLLCGHTHRQFDRRAGDWRVVGAGSVGLPYEGRPGAYWAILGPDVELRRTDYDVQAAAAAMRAGGFPDLEPMLRPSLLEPADPDEVARFFEGQATSGELAERGDPPA